MFFYKYQITFLYLYYSYIPDGGEVCVTTTEPEEEILMGEEIEPEIEVETCLVEEEDGSNIVNENDEMDNNGEGDEDDDAMNNTYECDKCGLILSKKSTFDIHMISQHVDEVYYACEFCPASAIHWSEYHLHQCTNMESKALVCPHCVRTVSTKKQLNVHEEIHALQRRFTTKKMENYFARKLEEAQDPGIDWGKNPFICGVCGKLFAKLYEVEYHEKLHNEERPSNKCSSCGMSYLSKNDLNKHVARGCSNEFSRKMIHTPTIT